MANQNSNPNDHRQTVGEWLSRSFVWHIPVYQRHYSWDSNDDAGPVGLLWKTLKEQAEQRLGGKTPAGHYLGSILVKKMQGDNALSGIQNFDVVDGQQRLTTIQISLLVLAKLAKEHNCGNEVCEKLEKHIFVNKDTQDPRLHPNNFDARQYQKILNDVYDIVWNLGEHSASRDNAEKSKIVDTFTFFEEEFEKFINGAKEHSPQHGAEKIIREITETILTGIDLVLIQLRETDNAQRVFESLNNNAKPLTTFDLIRNDVFYRAATAPGASPASVQELYYNKENWQQLEKSYWEEAADGNRNRANPTPHIDAYIARLLTAKRGEEFNYSRNGIFKMYGKCYGKNVLAQEIISDMVRHTKTYRYLGLETKEKSRGENPLEFDSDFGVFHYYNWPNRDFYPAIFAIINGEEAPEEQQKMIELLEVHVVRRAVCGFTMKNYNKQVASICAALLNGANYKNLLGELEKSKGDTRMLPDDEKILEACVGVNFYKCPFRHYVFNKIEMHLHQPHPEISIVDGLTIDHILPQGWEKNGEWEKMVSDTEAHMVNNYVNTIGNLTLMSQNRNSAKSNRPFTKVKKLLSDSGLKLNHNLAEEEIWNVKKITERSEEIGKIICQIWPYPDDK